MQSTCFVKTANKRKKEAINRPRFASKTDKAFIS